MKALIVLKCVWKYGEWKIGFCSPVKQKELGNGGSQWGTEYTVPLAMRPTSERRYTDFPAPAFSGYALFT